MTRSFKEVIAWQKAYDFTLNVYRLCRKLPDFERYGLKSQFTRAAVSIPANIAEGYKRLSKAEKLRFLNISQGSLEECRCYVMLARDLEYFTEEEAEMLEKKIEGTSVFLNKYLNAIVNNVAIKD